MSIGVPAGGIVTIIGANGAGKTTTLRSISGLARLESGAIRVSGERIDNLPAYRVAALGVGHVPEGARVFPELSVAENLRTGAFTRNDMSGIAADLEMVYERFPRLAERRWQYARTLSGGEQQMLAIGRALMLRPRILLLDEPSMGLAPVIVEEIVHILEGIREAGTPIVLVEQNAEIALELAGLRLRAETGSVALEAGPGTSGATPMSSGAYLGG